MTLFRTYLAIMFLALFIYTAIVIAHEGIGLITVFFSDMAELGWPGQFNADFMGFLSLSALWVAWRNNFSTGGLLLAIVAFFGGIMFLAPYLILASFKAGGRADALLLGAHYKSAT